MKAFDPFFTHWRTTQARGREIVEAVVRPEHRGPSAALEAFLAEYPGTHYWATGPDAGRLVLVRALGAPPAERWWLHGLLFAVTFVTIWMGGALLLGVETTAIPRGFDLQGTAVAVVQWVGRSAGALPFAMALSAILLAHELGHYFAARRYNIDASPPYFLPAPINLNFIGTFGAFIRLRSPVVDRRQLLDVGAAGPWAGFVVAMIMIIVGLRLSAVVPADVHGGMLIYIHNMPWPLGDSLLTLGLRGWLVGDGAVILHPLAFAGWLGLLVTTLNLLPLGQLDGGHILYALAGRWQTVAAWLVWFGLLALGAMQGPGLLRKWWWMWAALVLVLGAGRLGHPRLMEGRRPLPASRVASAWASMALFALTFAPFPI